MDPAPDVPPPPRGPAEVADELTRSGAFVECVFHCPECGLAGSGLVRPHGVPGKRCAACGELVIVLVR